MLRAPDARVLDVALACGFKTQQHFAQVFRDFWRVSPTQYRRDFVGSEVTSASPTSSENTRHLAISEGPFLFPSNRNPSGHQTALKTVWQKTLRRAKIPYFRIYDLRSTYATRLSAGGVADEWVTQMLRKSGAQVFKKYSQMKLQMKREALVKLNRRANEMAQVAADTLMAGPMCIVTVQ